MTAVIGTITPFIIIFVVLATGYTIVNADVDFSAMNDWAVNNVDTSLPNWWLSALNYTGLNVMTAVSMSIVIGGNFLDNRAVGIGGLIGGLLYLILLALLVFALFFEAKDVNGLSTLFAASSASSCPSWASRHWSAMSTRSWVTWAC